MSPFAKFLAFQIIRHVTLRATKNSKSLILGIVFLCCLTACGFQSSNHVDRPAPYADKTLNYDTNTIGSKLAQPKGLLATNLFSERLSDDNDRFDRLEHAVQTIKDDLNEAQPSINKLIAIEKDIQLLVKQLKTLVSDPRPIAVTPDEIERTEAPEIKSAPASTKPQALLKAPSKASNTTPKPVSNSGALAIDGIRIAEGGGKTRIVFDSNRKLNYTLDYDAGEGLIIVTSNAKELNVALSGLMKKSSIIDGVSALDESGGMGAVFALTQPAKVSAGTSLVPSKDNPRYRYFFDIYKK